MTAAVLHFSLEKEHGAEVVAMYVNSRERYTLEPRDAQRALVELHTLDQTLRGLTKPLRWRDRVGRVFQALRGH